MHKSSYMTITALALALAACSGGEQTPEASATTEAAPEAVEAAPTEAALEASVATETAEPEPTPTPTPTETAKPEPQKQAEAKPDPKPEPAPEPDPAPVEVAAADAPPPAFVRCAVCHTANKGGENKLGPNLWGVYGTKAAEIGDFKFSDALKDSGVTWDDDSLNAWLENPRKFIPNNRMSFPGLKDPAKRQEIIDFLKKQR